MVIRVDVVCAALEGAYGARPVERAAPSAAWSVLDAGRAAASTTRVRDELAGVERLTLLCGRYEGFDQRVHEHLATDAISIGRYVLSGGELGRDGRASTRVARKLPGALGKDESHRGGVLLAGAGRRASSTRTTRARPSTAAGRCRRCCCRATTARSTPGGASRLARRADARGVNAGARRSASMRVRRLPTRERPHMTRDPGHRGRASCARCPSSRPATPCACTFR